MTPNDLIGTINSMEVPNGNLAEKIGCRLHQLSTIKRNAKEVGAKLTEQQYKLISSFGTNVCNLYKRLPDKVNEEQCFFILSNCDVFIKRLIIEIKKSPQYKGD
jgi:hypothetical protein